MWPQVATANLHPWGFYTPQELKQGRWTPTENTCRTLRFVSSIHLVFHMLKKNHPCGMALSHWGLKHVKAIVNHFSFATREPKYLVKISLSAGFAQWIHRRGVTPLVIFTCAAMQWESKGHKVMPSTGLSSRFVSLGSLWFVVDIDDIYGQLRHFTSPGRNGKEN